MSSLIQSCFVQLDEYQAGLSEGIARYITQGDEQVLAHLSNLTLKQYQLASVSFVRNNHYTSSRAKNASLINKRFIDLYNSLALTNPAVTKRFAMVMAICADLSQIQRYSHSEVHSPDWLKILLCDLEQTFARFFGDLPIPTHFDGQWWLALVAQSDLPASIWLAELLERTCNRWGCKFVDTLMLRVDWLSLLKQNNIREAILQLDFSARLSLVTCLKQYATLNEILPFIVTLATDNSKKVRDEAIRLLSKLDVQQLLSYLEAHYSALTLSARKALIPVLPVMVGQSALVCLQQWLQVETNKSLKEILQNTLASQQVAQQIVKRELIIPPFTPLMCDDAIPDSLFDHLMLAYARLLEWKRLGAEQEKRENETRQFQHPWWLQNFEALRDYTAEHIRRDLQKLQDATIETHPSLFAELWRAAALYLHPEFTLCHLLRLTGFNYFREWVRSHRGVVTDIRQLAQLMQQEGLDLREIALWILRSTWSKTHALPDTFAIQIWPFFAEHDEYLDEAFQLIPSKETNTYYQFDLARGMLVVAQFPVIPEKYLQVLYQYALSASKTYGPLARQVLGHYGCSPERIIIALASSKTEERIVAANWIAELKLSEAIGPLQQALAKEKNETALAVLLSSLHKLNVDIREYLSPPKLLKEAQQGLSKAIPKGLDWFPFNRVPTLAWYTGKLVEAEIVKWWLVLACKLKQPEGNPLLDLYMQQLHPNSQRQLGLLVLQVFIQQDTLAPSDDTAHAYAQKNQKSLYKEWQEWAKEDWGKSYRNKTLEDAYRELFNQKKAEYLGSAVAEKGILALASYIEPASAVQLLTRYMKDHYSRRAQIEAILSSLAKNDEPVITQLLLSLARRYRTRVIQEKAGQLVSAIAERNHWTHDELADRTIPTAGFENNGQQVLEYASRNLIIRLGSELNIVLENEEGKALKSLPTPRQNDDAELIKQAKADFSNCKKELQQVISLQSERLYEAMCINRKWQGSEWREYLLEHPIMNRLLQQLVWQIQDGEQRYWVRPTAELELIDLDDEEHTLNDEAMISVAHISQMTADQAQAWRKHFKAEKVTPLFEQFSQPKHALSDEERKGKQLDYHKGWLTDAFTLRGVLTQRGYQRATPIDGSFFNYYYKDFTSLNLRLMIEFSGNCLPEENNPAALFHLAVVTPDQSGWISEDSYLPLANIPENLLNEAMLDYEAVAAKASFDAEWQKKIPC